MLGIENIFAEASQRLPEPTAVTRCALKKKEREQYEGVLQYAYAISKSRHLISVIYRIVLLPALPRSFRISLPREIVPYLPLLGCVLCNE